MKDGAGSPCALILGGETKFIHAVQCVIPIDKYLLHGLACVRGSNTLCVRHELHSLASSCWFLI